MGADAKDICSLPALRELPAANRRYLEFQPVTQAGRSYPGFNLFGIHDDVLFQAILHGEFNISGLQNKSAAPLLAASQQRPGVAPAQTPPTARIDQKVARGYKCYVTKFGKDVLTAGLKLRELVIIPQLAYGPLLDCFSCPLGAGSQCRGTKGGV